MGQREQCHAPGARTKGELAPEDRLEIEVVNGMQGLRVGIGRVGASELARVWGPDETSEGTTLSFTMSVSTRVGLAVSQGSGAYQRPKIENSKEQTILSYGSGVVLRVRVIRPGMQADRPSNGPTPNPDDNKPAPPRWEVVSEEGGKFSILTKEAVQSPGTITVQAVKLTAARWVNIGLRYNGQDEPNRPVQMSAVDKPQVFRIGFNSLKGSIRINRAVRQAREAEAHRRFQGLRQADPGQRDGLPRQDREAVASQVWHRLGGTARQAEPSFLADSSRLASSGGIQSGLRPACWRSHPIHWRSCSRAACSRAMFL